MPLPIMPAWIRTVLVQLNKYMHGFYPDLVPDDGSPLRFWEIGDDELFMEALGYLPLFIGEIDERLHSLPPGYRIACPVLLLEDDYQFNGWTALSNAGGDILAQAAQAYRVMGMDSEGAALDAARQAVADDPDDEAAHERAYKSVANRYQDDDIKFAGLLSYLRSDANLFAFAAD